MFNNINNILFTQLQQTVILFYAISFHNKRLILVNTEQQTHIKISALQLYNCLALDVLECLLLDVLRFRY